MCVISSLLQDVFIPYGFGLCSNIAATFATEHAFTYDTLVPPILSSAIDTQYTMDKTEACGKHC